MSDVNDTKKKKADEDVEDAAAVAAAQEQPDAYVDFADKTALGEGAGAAPEDGGGVVAAGDAGSDGASASNEPASRTDDEQTPEQLQGEREAQLLNVHVNELAQAHGIDPKDVNDPAARQVIGSALTGVDGPKTFRVFIGDKLDDSFLLDKVTVSKGVDLGDFVSPDTYVVVPEFEDEAAELEMIGDTPGRVYQMPIEQCEAFAADLQASLRAAGMRDINGDSQASDDNDSSDDGESTAGAAPEAAPVEYSRGDTVLVSGRQLKVLESSELHLMCLTQGGSRQRVLRSDVQRWSAA